MSVLRGFASYLLETGSSLADLPEPSVFFQFLISSSFTSESSESNFSYVTTKLRCLALNNYWAAFCPKLSSDSKLLCSDILSEETFPSPSTWFCWSSYFIDPREISLLLLEPSLALDPAFEWTLMLCSLTSLMLVIRRYVCCPEYGFRKVGGS